MQSWISALSLSISEIVASTGRTHTISLSDYHLLTTIVDNDFFCEFERKSAKRVLYLVRRGRITLFDDLTQGVMAA